MRLLASADRSGVSTGWAPPDVGGCRLHVEDQRAPGCCVYCGRADVMAD